MQTPARRHSARERYECAGALTGIEAATCYGGRLCFCLAALAQLVAAVAADSRAQKQINSTHGEACIQSFAFSSLPSRDNYSRSEWKLLISQSQKNLLFVTLIRAAHEDNKRNPESQTEKNVSSQIISRELTTEKLK